MWWSLLFKYFYVILEGFWMIIIIVLSDGEFACLVARVADSSGANSVVLSPAPTQQCAEELTALLWHQQSGTGRRSIRMLV